MTSVGMVSVSSLNGGSCRNEAKHLERKDADKCVSELWKHLEKAGLSWKMLLFFLLSFFRREDSYVMMNVHKLASIYGSSSEEDTATHSRILAWRIPWMEEPGRL